MTALTITERTELATLERVIDRGLETFREVGEALARIRDRQLYREQYATFRDYCRLRWSFTDRHARRLIVGAQVALECGPIGPPNESQSRELAVLPTPELRRQVFNEATSRGTRPTTAANLRLLTAEALAALPPDQQREAIEGSENRLRAGAVDKQGGSRPMRSQVEARKSAAKALKTARRQLLHGGPGAAALVEALDQVIAQLQALQ